MQNVLAKPVWDSLNILMVSRVPCYEWGSSLIFMSGGKSQSMCNWFASSFLNKITGTYIRELHSELQNISKMNNSQSSLRVIRRTRNASAPVFLIVPNIFHCRHHLRCLHSTRRYIWRKFSGAGVTLPDRSLSDTWLSFLCHLRRQVHSTHH